MTQPEEKKIRPVCPYCDEEVPATSSPSCLPCQVEFIYCSECGKLVAKTVKVCPYCGLEVRIQTEK